VMCQSWRTEQARPAGRVFVRAEVTAWALQEIPCCTGAEVTDCRQLSDRGLVVDERSVGA
jgi:hypothetical protein